MMEEIHTDTDNIWKIKDGSILVNLFCRLSNIGLNGISNLDSRSSWSTPKIRFPSASHPQTPPSPRELKLTRASHLEYNISEVGWKPFF